MDDVPRGGRLLLSLLLGAAARSTYALGCACILSVPFGCERPAESPAGVSSAHPPRPSTAADGGVVVTPASIGVLPSDFRTRYAKLTANRFVSAGHASGRFDVEVYANPAAASAYTKHTGTFPEGVVFVKEHWERAAGSEGVQPGPLMAMEKMQAGYDPEHGDWRYVVVGPDGKLLTNGKPEGCVLCHDDAPRDHVFLVK